MRAHVWKLAKTIRQSEQNRKGQVVEITEMLLLESFELHQQENEVECDKLPVKKAESSKNRKVSGGTIDWDMLYRTTWKTYNTSYMHSLYMLHKKKKKEKNYIISIVTTTIVIGNAWIQ